MKAEPFALVAITGMLLVGAVLAGLTFYSFATKTDNNGPYEPLEVVDFTVSPETVVLGGRIALRDGICNNSDVPVSATVRLGAQRERGALTSERVILFEADKVFSPGCIAGNAPLEGPLPASIGVGEWRFFLDVEVDAGSNQIQKLNLLSNIFTVLNE